MGVGAGLLSLLRTQSAEGWAFNGLVTSKPDSVMRPPTKQLSRAPIKQGELRRYACSTTITAELTGCREKVDLLALGFHQGCGYSSSLRRVTAHMPSASNSRLFG